MQAPNKDKMNKFLELYQAEKWPKCGDIGVISEKDEVIAVYKFEEEIFGKRYFLA